MNPILSSWNAEPPPGNSARIISSIYTKQLTSDTLAFMTRSLRHNPSRHPNVKNTLVALAIFFTFIFGNAASAADDNPDFLKPGYEYRLSRRQHNSRRHLHRLHKRIPVEPLSRSSIQSHKSRGLAAKPLVDFPRTRSSIPQALHSHAY